MSRPPKDPKGEADEDSNPLDLDLDTHPELDQNDGGTRVDMGDDLLDRTAVLTVQGSHAAPITPPKLDLRLAPGMPPPLEEPPPSVDAVIIGPLKPEQILDQMQSARILMGEGILEDAKRILRRILLTDSSLVEARKMLEEIHETELKQIFGESDTPRRRLRRVEPLTPVEISADIVMQGLDRDLKLGMFAENGAEAREPALSLFADKAAMDAFGAQMDRDFAGRPPVERIDVGVAFLEMGLYDLAVRHFEAALGTLVLEELEENSSANPVLAATGLLVYALILGGRAFEATIKLQPVLNDVDIERTRKLDLIYLMGRAFEAMGKRDNARDWYLQALEIEPAYRDTEERLRKVGGP